MKTRRELLFCSLFYMSISPLLARDLKGHLEPLFSHGKRLEVEVYEGFPTPEEFYKKFVIMPKPVLFRGGAMLSPAYRLWNEEYFLSFPESEEHLVVVEAEKKENRTTPGEEVFFAKFVRDLHSSGQYMVSSVPQFLRQDVYLPVPISCPNIIQGNLVQDMMWLSSGGTKSVLHNDHAENIMCVFKGTKEFFLIDEKYQDLVNVTERGYSDVDVDRVDLYKYPGLYEIEHHFAFIEPGDCLYVPFLWVHHVRSYGLNIAVNIWWRRAVENGFSGCGDTESRRTIQGLTFIGFNALYDAQKKMIKNRLVKEVISSSGNLSFGQLTEFFQKPDVFGPDVMWTEDMSNVVKKMFILMDQSADEIITRDELDQLQGEDWDQIRMLSNELMELAMAEYDGPIVDDTVTEEQWEQNTIGNAKEEDAHIEL
ncbi:unnamed protein product [Porites evermanni]|uniref:JmjC domain-containing protein n=1 Tax=Porites evermanni TaxID=104178 RepID=A0ABN8LM83_9CNID|nr:unnamed protein product [Porites evermanni]